MDIDIILECDVSPQQMVELGVEAERLGIRALWSSNYHQNWDAFISLVPVAQATSRFSSGLWRQPLGDASAENCQFNSDIE